MATESSSKATTSSTSVGLSKIVGRAQVGTAADAKQDGAGSTPAKGGPSLDCFGATLRRQGTGIETEIGYVSSMATAATASIEVRHLAVLHGLATEAPT